MRGIMYDTLNFHMAGIEPGQVLPLLDPKTAREVARVIDGKVWYQGNMKGAVCPVFQYQQG